MSPQITGVLIVVGFIVLYFVTYSLNAKTKVPEGVEKISKCSTCGSGSCSLSNKEKFLSSEDDECEIYVEDRH